MYKGSFTILPAVDIYEGQCVRLKQGDYNQITVYDKDPVRMARKWVDEGSSWLHVVDLEGARDGIFKNAPVIAQIAKACPVNIQAGGGVRSLDALESLFASGVIVWNAVRLLRRHRR
jgi:phosphoribosylformimino-5-aminoimidazole carboxamide ribotide isomerase